MWHRVKSKEEPVTSHAKQWHWGQSFRMKNLRTPLASLGKYVAPRIKNFLSTCGYFHAEGQWDGARCPSPVLHDAHGVQLRNWAHPWDEMGLQTQQCQAGPSPCSPSPSPTPRQASAQHNQSAHPQPPSAPPLDILAKDFGRHIPDFSTSSPNMFLWFSLAETLGRSSGFFPDLSQCFPQRTMAVPTAT